MSVVKFKDLKAGMVLYDGTARRRYKVMWVKDIGVELEYVAPSGNTTLTIMGETRFNSLPMQLAEAES